MTRIATLAGLVALLALAGSAIAGAAPAYACTTQDPTDCPTYEVPHNADLTVATPPRGSVSSNPAGISCPSDCAEDYSYSDFCTDLPGRDECEEGIPTEVTLTAFNGGAGYAPTWSGCDSSGGSTCSLTMDTSRSVSVSYTDVANPSASFSTAPSKVGPSSTFTAGATDNSGVVTKVDFYVDGVLRGTDTSSPYQFKPDLGLYADGSAHQVKVISQDGSGRNSTDLAGAPAANFTIDKSTDLGGVTTPAAHTQTVPAIAFTPPADAAGVVCRTKLGAGVTGTTPGCTSPYSPQGTTTDGAYTVELVVTDDVGNEKTVTRSFTLDRGAPNLTITSPAAGALVGGPFTAGYTADDGFTPDGDIDVRCKIDSGAFGSCSGLAPADGARTLTVRATDLAGNAEEKTVGFTYDATAPVAKITAGPGEGSVVYTRGASFAFTVSDLSAVTRSCRLDGGAFGACTSATGHTLGGLGLGIHTFTLRVTDAAGHVTTVQRRFTVADKPTDTGTPSTVVVTPPIADIIKQILNPSLSSDFDAFKGYTRYKRLVVKRVPAGATVTVKCKGKKCPAKSFKKTRAGNVKLSKFVKKKLRVGTTLTIQITKPGTIGKQFVIKVRAGKRPTLKISQIA